MPAKPTSVAAFYAASRLHFKTAIIEPLAMHERFRIDTPHGSFEMTKAEFYRDFANVVASRSYREEGGYHSPKPPRKALCYLTTGSLNEPMPVRESPKQENKNRRLTQAELSEVFAPLLADVRSRVLALAGADDALHFALRRKLFKELMYDERSKPMQRRVLKLKKLAEQGGKCAICQEPLPAKGSVLDRFEAMKGYVPSNVRILCRRCDTAEQEGKNYS